jgi:hypothetical protein
MSITGRMAFSLNLLTLYADLVQQVHARVERHGTVYRQNLKGAGYLYSKRNVGKTRRDIFLGREDDPEVEARVSLIKLEAALAKDRRKTIQALQKTGFPTPAPEPSAVLDALDDSGLLTKMVVVGTVAYQNYTPLIGDLLPRDYMSTQDTDFATISLALEADEKGETLETILKRADPTFIGRMGVDPKALPSAFRASSGFMVDLLTPILRRDYPNPMPLKNLRAEATPLQHLKWLIEKPVPICVLHGAGIPAFVPQPARFAMHKLLIAQKRTVNREKRQKDLAQAKALIDILKRRDPYALIDAREAAFAEGLEGWEIPIKRSEKELGITYDQ